MNTRIKNIYAADAFCFAMNSETLPDEYGVILEELHWTPRGIG